MTSTHPLVALAAAAALVGCVASTDDPSEDAADPTADGTQAVTYVPPPKSVFDGPEHVDEASDVSLPFLCSEGSEVARAMTPSYAMTTYDRAGCRSSVTVRRRAPQSDQAQK